MKNLWEVFDLNGPLSTSLAPAGWQTNLVMGLYCCNKQGSYGQNKIYTLSDNETSYMAQYPWHVQYFIELCGDNRPLFNGLV